MVDTTLFNVSDLDATTIEIGNDYIFGKLGHDLAHPNYLQKGCLMMRIDNVAAAFELANDMWERGESWGNYTRHDNSSHRHNESGWYGSDSFEKSLEDMRHHPNKYVHYTPDNSLVTSAEQAGNDVFFETTGDYLDIGRVLTGEPECFGNASEGKQIVEFAHIIVCGDANSDTSHEKITERNQQIQQLVDWLEYNNVRCRVDVWYTCECSHIEVAVKHYDEQLNISDLAIACAPDFFRRMTFVFSEYSDTWQDGYGSAHSFNGIKFTKNDDSHFIVCEPMTFLSYSMPMPTIFNNAKAKIKDAMENDKYKFVRIK